MYTRMKFFPLICLFVFLVLETYVPRPETYVPRPETCVPRPETCVPRPET